MYCLGEWGVTGKTVFNAKAIAERLALNFEKAEVLVKVNGRDYKAKIVVGIKDTGQRVLHDIVTVKKTNILPQQTTKTLGAAGQTINSQPPSRAFSKPSVPRQGRNIKQGNSDGQLSISPVAQKNKSVKPPMSPQERVVRQNNLPDTSGVPHAFDKESISRFKRDVKYSLSSEKNKSVGKLMSPQENKRVVWQNNLPDTRGISPISPQVRVLWQNNLPDTSETPHAFIKESIARSGRDVKYSLSSEKNKSARRPVVQTNNTVWNDTEEMPYAFKSMGRQAFTQKSAVQQNELLYAGGVPHAFNEESIAHSGRDVKDSLQNKSTERSVSPQKKVVRQNNSPDTEGVPHAFDEESIARSGQDVKYSLSNYDEEVLPNDMELWDDDVWEIMEESTIGRMAEHADLSNTSERSKKILEREGRRLKRALWAVRIAKEGLPVDVFYQEMHYPENNHSSKKRGIEAPYFWTPTTVGYILEKREYMGHTVLGKTICLDYKTKKRRKAKEDELIIFKNTHEAIIDEETWNNAQCLRKTVRRSPKYGTTSHPFTGLLICSDCGGKLSYREPAEQKEKKYDSDYSFVCQHYRHRKGTCSTHYIKVKTVNEILLKSIKEITDFAKEDKQEFLKLMNKLSDEKREEKYQRDKEKLEKLSSRNEELTILITKL